MLVCKYSDPPSGAVKNIDITEYILRYLWSGDVDQCARRLEFEIAFNTPDKDAGFIGLDLKLGGTILLEYVDDYGESAELFNGRIFSRKRNGNSYTFEFVAYDQLIYLAKNKLCLAFYNAKATDAINLVCSKIGIVAFGGNPTLGTLINFVADEKSGSEIIQMILAKVRADTGTMYAASSINGQLAIIKQGTLLEEYIADASAGVTSADHGENIENMINRVELWDDHGNFISAITAEADVIEYGTLQEIYKIQPPVEGESVDNYKAAASLLNGIESDTQLHAIGNIQCVSGYSIVVREDVLQGNFLIKSDTHTFENNTHMMDLTLTYIQ